MLTEALKQHAAGRKPDPKGEVVDLYVVRIGRYGPEGPIDPATEMNKGSPPPKFDHKQRVLQRWFVMQIKDLIEPFLRDERLPLVESWVCMEELDEPIPLPSPKKRSRNSNTPAVTPSPSATAALKTPEDDEDDGSHDGTLSTDDDYETESDVSDAMISRKKTESKMHLQHSILCWHASTYHYLHAPTNHRGASTSVPLTVKTCYVK